MATPASRSPANVTITTHRMIGSVLKDADRGRYVPAPMPLVIVAPPMMPPPPKKR